MASKIFTWLDCGRLASLQNTLLNIITWNDRLYDYTNKKTKMVFGIYLHNSIANRLGAVV